MKTVITKVLGFYLNTLAFIAPQKAGKQGFLLFCRPFRAAITQKQREFFNTAERSGLVHDDTRIEVYRWGRGEKKILFLHGWQSHSYRWKQYIEDLSHDEYTVYAFDAPGHGLSGGNFLSVPVYSDLIQNFLLQLGHVEAIVGHSLGGFSLLHTLHTYPLLQVSRVVLMAPPGEANDFFTFYQNTLGLSNRTMKLIYDYFKHAYNVSPDYFSATAFAEAINIPTLIIHDRHDAEAPHHYAEAIAKVSKRVRLYSTEGLGHNLRSMDVVKLVTSFVTRSEVRDNTNHREASLVQP
jgi:pimeloyl-ACP methyl ester carboxylesterase